MELFKGTLNINFVGSNVRRFWVSLSAALMLLSIVVVVWKQAAGTLNWGIDFAGGTVVDIEFDTQVDIAEVRKIVGDLGYKKAVIQSSGFTQKEGKSEFLIRVERIAVLDEDTAGKLQAGLREVFGEKLESFEFNEDSGDKFELSFSAAVNEREIEETMTSLAGKLGKKELAEVSAKKQGKEDENHFLVVMTGVASHMEKGMREAMPQAKPVLRKVEFVGPEVGSKLRNDGILAMIYALAGILVYVAFRFNPLFAPGAIVALIHDSLITVGLFALLGLEFNLTFVAAVLTIIGYSINDTIVIYDRIRENLAKYRSEPLEKITNTSINETLSRTILTNFATGLSLLGLLFLGFGEIQDFAIAMIFGIVVGTYSTIYIAGSLTLYLDDWIKKVRNA